LSSSRTMATTTRSPSAVTDTIFVAQLFLSGIGLCGREPNAAITAARHDAGDAEPLVVDLHPDRPDQRGILLPGGLMIMLPEEPTFAADEDPTYEADRPLDDEPIGDSA